MENYYTEKLAAFVGGKITGVAFDNDGEGFFGIKVKVGRKENIIWFLRDDEGNGPGSFDVQEVK